MMKIKNTLIFLFSLLACMVVLTACQGTPAVPLDINTVQEFADPATEATLQGFSENDLEKYVEYGNAEFKAAVTPEVFKKVAVISDQLGKYQSKEILRAEEQGAYIIVHYKAKFANSEAGIRMVFDSDHKVAGQWFE